MDISICFIIFNLFTFSSALNVQERIQGQRLSHVDISDLNLELLQRLEDNEKHVQQLLGRVDYLEAKEIDNKNKIEQLRKQLHGQGQRTSYLDRLLRRKECTLCARKLKNFDVDTHDMDIKETSARNIQDDKINRIRRELYSEEPIAFFAGITNSVAHAGVNQTFVFDHAITNIGSAYNSHNGNFVAPLDGTYVFAVTLMSTYHTSSHARFFKNGQSVSLLYVSGAEGGHDTSSQTIILQLKKGDDVCVHNMDNDVSMAGAHYSTFAGFLLQESSPSPVVVGRK